MLVVILTSSMTKRQDSQQQQPYQQAPVTTQQDRISRSFASRLCQALRALRLAGLHEEAYELMSHQFH